jgi:hypothetical protein
MLRMRTTGTATDGLGLLKRAPLHRHRARGDPRLLSSLPVAAPEWPDLALAARRGEPCAFRLALDTAPGRSGRVYAAYRGVYVATALIWLRLVDGLRLSAFDIISAGVALIGMAIIVLGWRGDA